MGKQKYGAKTYENKPIRFDRKILNSKAFWKLSGVAPHYLLVFLGKRQMHHVKAERIWVIRNNGEITFTYAEAKNRFGIAEARHIDNMRKLHEVGFIDISHLGGGMEGDSNKFSISKRWEKYGTPDFEKKEWPKDTRKKGNPRIAKHGKGRVNG